MHKVLIRRLSIEDASISFQWRNDPEIWEFTGHKPDIFITEEIEKKWLSEKLTEKNSSRFAIIADDQYIGNIQITDIIENEHGQYHIFIGEKSFWGKGIAKLATAQIIRFAKDTLKLKELYLVVDPSHRNAIKLYEKCGFNKVNNEIRMSLNLIDSQPPIVSVFVMTYNHEHFIAQALEGILMQKTNFDVDIVVGEDCSTDNTRKIILDYDDKYPGKFKLLLHKNNIGAMANQSAVLNDCTGKYIAFCEGDDYWTDPLKLQKQVDLLETDQSLSGSSHGCTMIYTSGRKEKQYIYKYLNRIEFSWFLKSSIFITTGSLIFRTNVIEKMPPFSNELFAGDTLLKYLMLSSGDIGYIPEDMSIYRKGSIGSWSNRKITPKIINKEFSDNLRTLYYIDEITEYAYHNVVQWKTKNLIAVYLKYSIPFNKFGANLKNFFYAFPFFPFRVNGAFLRDIFKSI